MKKQSNRSIGDGRDRSGGRDTKGGDGRDRSGGRGNDSGRKSVRRDKKPAPEIRSRGQEDTSRGRGNRGFADDRGRGDRGRDRNRRADEPMVVFGIHPVAEFLKVKPDQIRYVLIDRRTPSGAVKIAREAAGAGIPVREASDLEFSELVGYGNAQGIVAVLKPLQAVDGEDLIRQVAEKGQGLLVALDSVQDPQNLGSILRTAAFFGADGVIITSDRSVRLTASAVKASAGGAARVPVGEVTNLARSLKMCADLGMTVAGTVVHGGRPLYELSGDGPMVIVLGSEGTGMRRLVAESCSMLVTLPSPSGFDSLNVGVTAGIMLCAAATAVGKTGE